MLTKYISVLYDFVWVIQKKNNYLNISVHYLLNPDGMK